MVKKTVSEEEIIKKIDRINKEMENIKQKNTEKKPTENEESNISKNVKINNKKNNSLKSQFGLFEIIIVLLNIALIFCLFGYFIGNKLNTNNNKDYVTVDEEIQLFIDQYNEIVENYYGDIDKKELIKNAIDGMLSTLDDYSGVVDEGSNTTNILLEGEYNGLGISIANVYEEIIVVNVYDDTPASKAGIQVGDVITHLNGESLTNVSAHEFTEKAKEINEINLTLLRDSKEMKITLKKDNIVLKSVYYEMREDNIGYIQLSIFASNTYYQFKEALNNLEKQGMKSLIIDVRGNSGGHLSSVRDILGLFMDESYVIYQTETKDKIEKFYSDGKETKKYKIVILQDVNSASASEILASSLRENLNAYIIGKTSFGKGTVQQLKSSGEIDYKITIKKWLTPKGNWINEVGIVPDEEVALTIEYINNPTLENDTQYQAALKYLK